MARFIIEIDIGTTYRTAFRPAYDTEVEGEIVRTYYDLDNCTFTFVIRNDRYQWVKDYSENVTVEDEKIYVHLSPEETSQLRPHNRYYWQLDITFESGDVRRLVEGPLYVRPNGIRQEL